MLLYFFTYNLLYYFFYLKSKHMKITNQNTLTLNGISKKIGCLFLGLLFMPIVMMATHFRYGSISNTNISGNTVVFKLQQSWRLNYPWGVGPISVGTIINVSGFPTTGIGTSPFSFGDGTEADMILTVTSVNPGENSFFGEAILTHTYAAPGNYTAFYGAAARIHNLVNNGDGLYRIATNVNVGSGNSSPVSTITPIVDVPINNPAYMFTIPAGDANGNTLSFRFSTSAEAGSGFVQPAGLSINGSTGQMTFNTMGTIVGQLYSTQIMISDGFTEVPLDFLIRISSSVGTPPYFVYPPTPANGSIVTVVGGQTINLNLEAADADAPNTVFLNAVGVPIGATFSPASGNPVTSTFTWVTTPANLGTYVISFNAQDNTFQSANTSVTINVIECNITLEASTTNLLCFGGSSGEIDLSIAGANGSTTVLWSNGATTEDITGLTAGTYSVTVTDALGCTQTATYTLTQPTSPLRCGITVSPSPTVAGHAINTIYLGYGAQSVTLSGLASGGTSSYSYSWGSAGTGASITVSPIITTMYTLTITDANDCTSTCSVTINVVDVRCGHKMDKVLVCHRTNGVNQWNNICISSNAVATHLAHGDYLGTCTTTNKESSNSKIVKNIDKENLEAVNTKIKVTPNPTYDYFILQINEAIKENANIRITDMFGNNVEQFNNLRPGQIVRFGNAYKQGNYIAIVKQGNNIESIKLWKR
jgi:hypothetical protein